MAIYKDIRLRLACEGQKCAQRVNTRRVLKQGCPLSPILLMLYMAGLEKKLEETQLGFNLTHMLQGEMVQQRILGMLYADDHVLLADNQTDMQQLINIRGQEGTDLGLNFSARKLAIMAFSDTSTDGVSIQHI